MKFKVGDKLLCIKDSLNKAFWLDQNKIYTIKRLDYGNNLLLENYPDLWYTRERFIKANSKIIKEKLGVK